MVRRRGGGGGGSRLRRRAVPIAQNPIQFNVGDTDVIVDRREDDPKLVKSLNPLFRFGAPMDAMSSLVTVREGICFLKCFSNLVELIVNDGVTQSDMNYIAWMMSHCEGNLYINTPTHDDPKKLLHIFNVTGQKVWIRDLSRAMLQVLHTYPTHYVLTSKFHVGQTIFGSALMNKHSMKRMYEQVNLSLESEL